MQANLQDNLGAVDKERLRKGKERNGHLRRENSAFVTDVRGKDNRKADGDPVTRSCQMRSAKHGIWQCEKFKQQYQNKRSGLQIKHCVSNALVQVIMLQYAQKSISGAKYLVVERSIIHCYMLLRRRATKRSRRQVKTMLKAKWSQGRESLECV